MVKGMYYLETLTPISSLTIHKFRQILSFCNKLVWHPQSYITISNCQKVVHKAHWIVPFEKNTRFTGREYELAQLEGLLFAEDRTTKIAITGLGGVGKTNLLIEFVHRTRKKYPSCSIIWLPATNMESLQQAYLDVAQKLRIAGREEDKADVKRLVQKHLSKESTGQWLLVFDNADDINMWIDTPVSEQKPDRLIEYLPMSNQGCIVFTTRDRKAAYKLVHRMQNIIEVPSMNEDVAIQLLQNYLHLTDQDLVKYKPEAKALVEQLTYLPLAIVQAAAYINENNETITKYLALLSEQEADVIELLSEGFEDEGRYRDVKNPVATTFLVSFDRIRRRDPLAADYLSLAACMSPKSVPLSLLPPGSSKKEETDALGTLDAYSFIFRQSAAQAFDIHRLVHLATRSWLQKEDLLTEWTKRAVTRLEEVFPSDDHQNRSAWKAYLVHAHYVLESNFIENSGENTINLAEKYGLCLISDGRWREAEELFVQVTKTREIVLGKEHPDTLKSMNNLAILLNNQSKCDATESLFRETLQLAEKVLGKEHPDTLKSMNNLAILLKSQGNYNAAEPIYRETLQLAEKVLGKEHPDTLRIMNNLASLLKS